jgi:squalene-associated FAD-dependent desaturase
MRHPVAVLGAGWAGLAAAVELTAAGVPVSVFEAARTLGGRARRVELNGLHLDNGAHILVGAYKETLRLIRSVQGDMAGLRTQPLDLHIQSRFRVRAPPLPAPLHLAAALLGAQGMPWGERFAAARFMHRMRRARFRIDPDITVSELLARHAQGENARRFLWEPLCVGALNTLPGEASAQVFLNVLRDSLNGARSDSQILLPARDLSSVFPDAAARFVESHGGSVVPGCAVHTVVARGDAFEVVTTAGPQRFDAVVCALPPYRVPEVLAAMPSLQPMFQQMRALRFQPIYCAYLQYPAHVRLPQPMLGLAGGFGQWVFDRGALCGQAGLVSVVISARGQHEELERAELVAQLHAELRSQFPALPEHPLWSKVIGEQRATFACTPGLSRPPQRTPVENLYLAGDYTESPYPGTLEAAVRSGVTCAQLALQDLSNNPQRLSPSSLEPRASRL